MADVRALDLSARHFRTQFGGLFLFVPYMDEDPASSGCSSGGRFPGTQQIPAAQAMRSLLALEALRPCPAQSRHEFASSIRAWRCLPASTSSRSVASSPSTAAASSGCYPKLMQHWFDALSTLGYQRGVSFDLDFHTIPFHGEDALLEKHYVSKRSRRQKGVLAFLAQDAQQASVLLCQCGCARRAER